MKFIAKHKNEVIKATDAVSDYVVDMDELEKAIKYHEEMSRERYLNDGGHAKMAKWLKELKWWRENKHLCQEYHKDNDWYGYIEMDKEAQYEDSD